MLRSNMDTLLNDEYYVTPSMKEYIKKCVQIHTIKTSKFKINGYSTRPKKVFINKLNKCAKRIEAIYKLYPNLKQLNIHVVDCPQKRKYIDDPVHVNGGFTWLNRNDIFVFRSKEFCKVMLHEVLHHCVYYPHSTPVNEAITEFLATIHQCRFTHTPISEELKHSEMVAQHVIQIPITNKSNLYAYTVLKYALLKEHKLIEKYIKHKQFDLINNYIDRFTITKKTTVQKVPKELIMVSCGDK